ncbi:MAG: RDD family protein, partial [Acidimicrobiales bacterium]
IIILAIVSGIITAILGVSTFDVSETDPITGDVEFDFGAFGASSAISLVIGLLYSGLLEGSARGQSVGKMALGIQVRDADSGGPIGFGKAVLRRLVYNLLFYALAIPGIINVLSPLWDARKQAWHDKAVNSLVVNKA